MDLKTDADWKRFIDDMLKRKEDASLEVYVELPRTTKSFLRKFLAREYPSLEWTHEGDVFTLFATDPDTMHVSRIVLTVKYTDHTKSRGFSFDIAILDEDAFSDKLKQQKYRDTDSTTSDLRGLFSVEWSNDLKNVVEEKWINDLPAIMQDIAPQNEESNHESLMASEASVWEDVD
jgi:hypothetical protein